MPISSGGAPSDFRAWGEHAVLGDDHHPFVDGVPGALGLDHALDVADHAAVADARVFVDDRALDDTGAADAERSARRLPVLLVVGAEDHGIFDLRPRADLRASADDRALDLRALEAAAVGDQRLPDRALRDARGRQIARPGID